jgi:hypothetical protein
MHRVDPRRLAVGIARGAGTTVGGIVAAVIVALGVPLVWVWIASQLAGNSRDVTPSLAILITTGILVSYWVVLLFAGRIRGRLVGEEARRAQSRRMSWNRSFRDEHRPGDGGTDPVERLFVLIAVAAIIAFEIWFFFFAGSPLPNQPLF